MENDSIFCLLTIQDEEDFLPYSIPSLVQLQQSGFKLIIVLDRCSDSSAILIKTWLPQAIVHVKTSNKRKFGISEVKSIGYDVAREHGAKILLVTDADIVVDAKAVQQAVFMLKSTNYQVIVLSYSQYPLFGSILTKTICNLQNLIIRVIRALKIHPVRGGFYVGKLDFMKLDEDVDSEYNSLQDKCKTTWITTSSIHLRPRMDIASQLKRGVARAELPQYSLSKIIISSAMTFQPFLFVGYLKEKLRR